MQQPLYGLIGGKLGHSYSKIIHEQIADYTYDLLPLPTEAEARSFMQARAFTAINVTIPYKQFVIPYCDEVDPKAKAIGAVNTIVKNRTGEVSSCDVPFSGNLARFNADHLRLTRQAAEFCENHDLTDSMVIGTSAIVDTEIDGAVDMNSGIFNNPFIIWGRFHKKQSDLIALD